jgi:hypothetical protein
MPPHGQSWTSATIKQKQELIECSASISIFTNSASEISTSNMNADVFLVTTGEL